MKKTAIITGASSGIGKEAAARFVALGYHVLGCARRIERLEQMREELGENFIPVQSDLTNEDSIGNIFDEALRISEHVDVLVNNAGIGYETTLTEGDPNHWKEMIQVNLLAVALCTRRALDIMLRKDQGHIFTVSSMSAHRVTEGGGVYSASKYGVRALIEGLRQELSAKKSKVRTTLVSPGFVETEFYNYYYHQQEHEEIDRMFDEMKALHSKDVVEAIIYSLQTPLHVGINDILMRPIEQMS